MTPEELAALLGCEDIRPGRSRKVLSPLRDERTPSLHVTHKKDGTWLFHDFGDEAATLDDFAGALSNGHREIPTARVRRVRSRETASDAPIFEASYTYRDDKGREYVKHRRGRGEGKEVWWNPAPSPDARLLLYRDVSDAIAADETVYLGEGEEDVHALESVGAVATTSGGTGSWKAHHAEALRGAHVLIVADADTAGRRHALTVKRSLLNVARSVHVLEPSAGKDADDHLASGQSLDDLLPADRFQPQDLGAVMEGGIDPPPFLVADVFYEGRAHALAGAPGDGKTLLVLALCSGLVAGERTVAWFDEENGPLVVAGRLLALGVTPLQASQHFAYFPFSEPALEDADELVAEMAALRPAVVVFDSGADMYAASSLNENDNMDMTRWALAFSQRLSREHGIASVVLEHVAKAGDGNYQRGAGAKKAKVDALWMLEVLSPFDLETVGEVELIRAKDRLGHLPPRVRYRLGGDGSGVTTCERIDAEDEDAKRAADSKSKRDFFASEALAALEREGAFTQETGLSQRQLTGFLPPAPQTFKNELVQSLPHEPRSRVRRSRGARNSFIYWLEKEGSDD